jgi:hypothetical protein
VFLQLIDLWLFKISKSTCFSALFSFDIAFWLFVGGKKKATSPAHHHSFFRRVWSDGYTEPVSPVFRHNVPAALEKNGCFFHSVSAGAGKLMSDNLRVFSYAFSKQ